MFYSQTTPRWVRLRVPMVYNRGMPRTWVTISTLIAVVRTGWTGYSNPPDIKQILINMFMHPADDDPILFNLL